MMTYHRGRSLSHLNLSWSKTQPGREIHYLNPPPTLALPTQCYRSVLAFYLSLTHSHKPALSGISILFGCNVVVIFKVGWLFFFLLHPCLKRHLFFQATFKAVVILAKSEGHTENGVLLSDTCRDSVVCQQLKRKSCHQTTYLFCISITWYQLLLKGYIH